MNAPLKPPALSRVETFESLYNAGARCREDFLDSFCPEDGVPMEDARRAWLSRELDKATAAVRRRGDLAISFNGQVLLLKEGAVPDSAQAALLFDYCVRQHARAAAYKATAARIEAITGQLNLDFGAEEAVQDAQAT